MYFVYVEREYICTTKRIHFPCYTLYLVYVVNVYMLSIGFLLPSMLHINHGVCYREVVLDNNQSYKRAKYILLLFEIERKCLRKLHVLRSVHFHYDIVNISELDRKIRNRNRIKI